jgi:putative ABC transport system permease protein
MFLARRNLFQSKLRFAMSVSGVALALMLILLLNGFQAGMERQISAYLDHAPGTLVVTQEGVSNMLGATSLLPPGTTQAAQQIAGVEQALPILSQFVILELHAKKQPIYLIGYDPLLGGGPWRLAAGRVPQADSEVVFDRVLAGRHDIGLGDSFALLGQDFTIVGLSDGTTSWMTSYVFVRKTAIEALVRVPEATSLLLVTLAPGSSGAADRLAQLPGVSVLLKTELVANDLALITRVFSAPLRLMTTIAFLVGTLMIGLVIYTASIERQREYGMLKAVGARNRLLYRIVTAQALIVAGLGAILGGGLVFAAARLIMALRPQFLIVIDPADAGIALVAGLGMALLAAILPARAVARLAPAEVFRR